jgi:hypothetical protein
MVITVFVEVGGYSCRTEGNVNGEVHEHGHGTGITPTWHMVGEPFACGHLLLMANLVREGFRGGGKMPLDNEVIEAMGGLIRELRNAVGDKALKLPSVRKAMRVLGRNAWEDAQRFVREVEAREFQEDLTKEE